MFQYFWDTLYKFIFNILDIFGDLLQSEKFTKFTKIYLLNYKHSKINIYTSMKKQKS